MKSETGRPKGGEETVSGDGLRFLTNLRIRRMQANPLDRLYLQKRKSLRREAYRPGLPGLEGLDRNQFDMRGALHDFLDYVIFGFFASYYK